MTQRERQYVYVERPAQNSRHLLQNHPLGRVPHYLRTVIILRISDHQEARPRHHMERSQLDQVTRAWHSGGRQRHRRLGGEYTPFFNELMLQDALIAKEYGADAVVLSNHGGRQLD